MSLKPSLLSSKLLTPHQQEAITRLYEGDTLLVAKMGAGKTVIAASAITELLDDCELERVLVITTPKIANTVWAQEFAAWNHSAHISVACATGAPDQRLQVFNSDSQVVVTTFNVLPWIKENKLFRSFDGLLVDESTKLKTPGGAHFKALRRALPGFKWRVALTGTPVSEDFLALYAQCMIIDQGKALGTRFDSFKNRYFEPLDYKRRSWAIRDGMQEALLDKIGHLVYVMDDYRGELPPIEYQTIYVTPPADLRKYYKTIRKRLITEHVKVANQAVLVQKLQQVASGFIYDRVGDPVRLSDYRVAALAALRDSLQGNVIIVYGFREDMAAIKTRLPDAVGLDPKATGQTIDRWNRGEIKTLLIHPRSAAHGLQLEKGGHQLIWYTPQWSRDLWEQTNARIWRRGQTSPVTIYTITAKDTIDEAVNLRVENKAQFDRIFNDPMRGHEL